MGSPQQSEWFVLYLTIAIFAAYFMARGCHP